MLSPIFKLLTKRLRKGQVSLNWPGLYFHVSYELQWRTAFYLILK